MRKVIPALGAVGDLDPLSHAPEEDRVLTDNISGPESLDADFLGTWISPVAFTAQYQRKRVPDDHPSDGARRGEPRRPSLALASMLAKRNPKTDLAALGLLAVTVLILVKIGWEPLAATVAEHHYGWKIGIPAYLLASGIGLSRVESSKHNLSDVLAGATLGYISGITAVRQDGKPLDPLSDRSSQTDSREDQGDLHEAP